MLDDWMGGRQVVKGTLNDTCVALILYVLFLRSAIIKGAFAKSLEWSTVTKWEGKQRRDNCPPKSAMVCLSQMKRCLAVQANVPVSAYVVQFESAPPSTRCSFLFAQNNAWTKADIIADCCLHCQSRLGSTSVKVAIWFHPCAVRRAIATALIRREPTIPLNNDSKFC